MQTTVPSRYSRSPRLLMMDDSSTFKPALAPSRTSAGSADLRGAIKHVVSEGQTFQDIAILYYRAPEFWYVLASANPQIEWPLDLPSMSGSVITVPDPLVARTY